MLVAVENSQFLLYLCYIIIKSLKDNFKINNLEKVNQACGCSSTIQFFLLYTCILFGKVKH